MIDPKAVSAHPRKNDVTKYMGQADTRIEMERYNIRAKEKFKKIGEVRRGAESVDIIYRQPYLFYEKMLGLKGQGIGLELGCGCGEFSEPLRAACSFSALVDISIDSLQLLRRYDDLGADCPSGSSGVVEANIEQLPFADSHFDTVAAAGVLSYGDNVAVMKEIYRVLKPGGSFICIDSLNDSFIYRLNRYFKYLKGDRSKSTLSRMPDSKLLKLYKELFTDVDVSYFGRFCFLMPLIAALAGRKNAAILQNKIDRRLNANLFSFKFIMVAKR